MLKRTLEIEKEYTRFHGKKAINHFFNTHKELDFWKEQFEWMFENNIDFFSDDTMNDGSKNNNWSYALHFDDNDDITYICIIERS